MSDKQTTPEEFQKGWESEMCSWTKLPAIEGGIHGCLTCGRTHSTLAMIYPIIAGFGDAIISRDGKEVYRAAPARDAEDFQNAPALSVFEALAAADPDRDWRFFLNLPLRSATYQRHGKEKWVLVDTGRGFA